MKRSLLLLTLLLPALPAVAAPKLDSLAPLGGQRGTAVQVRAAGADLGDVTGMWFADPRLSARLEPGGKPAEQHLTVSSPPDMPPGRYECRLLAKSGISEARLFCVGVLPELPESAETTTQSAPQELKAPVTVVGQINANTKAEWFRFALKQGEWATVVCVARAAGSRLDPFLRALDPAGRTVVRNDDAGTNRDARIHFQAKEDGAYTVELRDLGYRGGDGFPFRLSFYRGPYVTHAEPLAVQAGTRQTVQALVSGERRPVTVTAPADYEPELPAAEVRVPGAPDPFPLIGSRFPQVVEAEAHRISRVLCPEIHQAQVWVGPVAFHVEDPERVLIGERVVEVVLVVKVRLAAIGELRRRRWSDRGRGRLTRLLLGAGLGVRRSLGDLHRLGHLYRPCGHSAVGGDGATTCRRDLLRFRHRRRSLPILGPGSQRCRRHGECRQGGR